MQENRKNKVRKEVVIHGKQITDRFKRSLDYAVTKITQWEHRERILAVYLYGSYARNEQSADSDIDLYIQTDTKTDRKMIRELNSFM